MIEHVLRGRLGRFFDVVADLQQILEDANERVDGRWMAPSTSAVSDAQMRLADFQHRRVFYHGLSNPTWVAPLDQLHAFDDPPSRETGHGTGERWAPWPPGDYLYAMASHAPSDVATILARVVSPERASSVQQLVISVAVAMPEEEALTLVPTILRLIDAPDPAPLLSEELVRLAEKIAAVGRPKLARKLAQRLFEPRADPAEVSDDPQSRSRVRGLRRRDVTAGYDTHLYNEALEQVVRAFLPSEILPALVAWLARHQELSGAYVPGEETLGGTRGRPSISPHPQNWGFDSIGDALIDTVRDTAAGWIREGGLEAVLDTLRRRTAPVMSRIELCVLAMTVVEREDALAVAATSLIDADLCNRHHLHREFHELGSVALPLLGNETYSRWQENILTGPRLEDREVAAIAQMYEDLPADEAVSGFRDRWQLEALAAVGAAALRDRAPSRYAELVDVYGEPDHPGFLSWHTTTVGYGEESETAAQEFQALSPADVVASCRDASHAPDSPTETGARSHQQQPLDRLAHAFGGEVRRRPHAFSALTTDVLNLDPVFVGRFFLSLSEVLRERHAAAALESASDTDVDDVPEGAGKEALDQDERFAETTSLDWTSLLEALATNARWRSPSEDTAGYDSWRWVRRQICSLLDDAADEALPRHLLQDAATLILSLTGDPDPDGESSSQGSDAFTMALNSVRPQAIRTLLRLAMAQNSYRSAHSDSDFEQRLAARDLTTKALQSLGDLLSSPRDPSTAVAAAIGERAGWLLDMAPEWMDQHRARLLTPDPFGDVFVTATLALYQPHPTILDYLTPALETMLDRAEQGAELTSALRQEQSPLALVGSHLFGLYLWGRIDLDASLLVRYFTCAPLADRAELLRHVGWRFFHTDSLELEALSRAGRLWDSRLDAVERGESEAAELAGFEWWVRCGLFAVEWWLPRLTRVAELKTLSGRLPIEKELISASQVDPASTVNVLRLLVHASTAQGRLPYGLRQAAPTVLAAALDSDGADAASMADALIEHLGRHGDLGIRPDVDAQRHAPSDGLP